MDPGVQRRGRGDGQAAGPAARPELAAPSAAAVPREIPTCSASLLFRLFRPASHRLPRAVPLPVYCDAFSARPVRGYAAAGPLALRCSLPPRYPQYGAIITTSARLNLSLCSAFRREEANCGRHPPPTHCHTAHGADRLGGGRVRTQCQSMTPNNELIPFPSERLVPLADQRHRRCPGPVTGRTRPPAHGAARVTDARVHPPAVRGPAHRRPRIGQPL